MDVYVINLDRHAERWNRIRRLLDDERLNVLRIRALDGARLKDKSYRARPRTGALRPNGTVLTRYELACLASHRRAWRKFLQSDARTCLILEDDVYFAGGFADLICDPRLAETKFDIVKFEAFPNKALVKMDTRLRIGERWIGRLKSHTSGAGGYLITRPAAERLLALSRNFPNGADSVLYNFQIYAWSKEKPFAVGQVMPAPIVQQVLHPDAPRNPLLDSYIGSNRGVRERQPRLSWFKFSRELFRPFRQLRFLLWASVIEFG